MDKNIKQANTFGKQCQQVAIAFDQLLGTLFGLVLYPFTRTVFWADETISSWAFRSWIKGKWYGFLMHFIDFIFCWQEAHCEDAFYSERIGRQLPPELRK